MGESGAVGRVGREQAGMAEEGWWIRVGGEAVADMGSPFLFSAVVGRGGASAHCRILRMKDKDVRGIFRKCEGREGRGVAAVPTRVDYASVKQENTT